MSMIAELANRLGVLPPALGLSSAAPGAYLAYIASLILEFGAGATLFIVLGVRLWRVVSTRLGGWSIPPAHVFKLVIPVACLVTSATFLAFDIR